MEVGVMFGRFIRINATWAGTFEFRGGCVCVCVCVCVCEDAGAHRLLCWWSAWRCGHLFCGPGALGHRRFAFCLTHWVDRLSAFRYPRAGQMDQDFCTSWELRSFALMAQRRQRPFSLSARCGGSTAKDGRRWVPSVLLKV